MPTLHGQVAESHSLKEHKHNDRYLCGCLGKMSSAIYSASDKTKQMPPKLELYRTQARDVSCVVQPSCHPDRRPRISNRTTSRLLRIK